MKYSSNGKSLGQGYKFNTRESNEMQIPLITPRYYPKLIQTKINLDLC